MERKEVKIILIILLWIVLCVFSRKYDNEIVQFLVSNQNFILNEIFIGMTFVSSEIIIFFFLTSLFLWRDRKRRWVVPLWVGLFLTAFFSVSIKLIVGRLRPFQQGIVDTLPILKQKSFEIWNYSFPSFQAMMVFCALPILSKEFPKFKYVWTAFAFAVAFSRIYFGVHFMSDVVFGSIFGYFLGLGIVYLEEKYKFGEKAYKKIKK